MSEGQAISTQPPTERFQFSVRKLLYAMVALSALLAIIVQLVLPTIHAARARARASACINNLKQIGIGLLNYHDVYQCFPPAVARDSNGKPRHSWRTAITPFLNSSAFYLQYDQDQSWDSPKNLACLAAFNGVHESEFRCPESTASIGSGFTNYVMVVGPQTVAPPARAMNVSDISDGPAHTVMIVEIAESDIHWAEPRDLEFDKMSFKINDASQPSISSHHIGGAMLMTADGVVRFLDEATAAEAVKAMLTAAAGDEDGLGKQVP
jgi:uncharacterized protein DUF1559